LASAMRTCVVSNENIAPEGQYAFLGWHLQDQIDIVQYHHKLGQSWSAKYGVVCSFEVHDDEVYESGRWCQTGLPV
jgi:hypothetical protein